MHSFLFLFRSQPLIMSSVRSEPSVRGGSPPTSPGVGRLCDEHPLLEGSSPPISPYEASDSEPSVANSPLSSPVRKRRCREQELEQLQHVSPPTSPLRASQASFSLHGSQKSASDNSQQQVTPTKKVRLPYKVCVSP